MAENQRIMQAIIRIGGEMDKSVKTSMSKMGKSFVTLNKKCASFEKAAVKAAAGAAAAFAGAAGAMAIKFVKSGDELNKAMNQVAAATGATGKELEALNGIARDIYKSGLGESMQEVTDALVNIEQASGLAGDELKEATKNAIALKDTFGFDVAESTRAASALMKNFGISADEAYGIMTYGAQNGANKNGDMLDTLNEYSVHYKALGFNAEQFVTSLIKGAEAGSWSIDKVGDAVKEFTIRSKDGSKKSLEAFQQIGLNGEEMTRAFANGGEEASTAFKKTVDALKKMKDPVKKNAAGVALFGTMFEDLEAGVLDTLGSMEGATVDAVGAMKKLEEVKYNDLGTSISQISRSLEDALIPSSQEAAKALNENMPAIQQQFEKLQPYLSDLGEKVAKALPGIIKSVVDNIPVVIEKIKEVFRWLSENKDTILAVGKAILIAYGAFRSFMIIGGIVKTISSLVGVFKTLWPILKVVGLAIKGFFASNPIVLIIIGVIAAIWLLWKNWDTVCAALKIAWEAVSEFFAWAWEGIKNAWSSVVDAIGGAWDSVCGGIKNAWEGVKNFFSSAVDWLSGIFTGLWDGIKNAAKTVFESLPSILKTPINAIISIVNGAIDAINQIGFTIPDWVPVIGGKAFQLDIPKLPMLATGGFTNGASIAGEAGTEAVISFDPAYRRQNQGYLMTAAEMLGMTAAPKASGNTYNLGGITFSPVLQTGDKADSGNVLQQLRACLPDLMDMIEEALREKEAHRYV